MVVQGTVAGVRRLDDRGLLDSFERVVRADREEMARLLMHLAEIDLRKLWADLAHPSPYNTYVHRGLPPGPIANPGAESLRAARCPGDAEFLYFVSMNTGRHHFSRTLREHEEAVRKYQR